MARKVKKKPPSELVLDLFAPGMTPMHRAGLGGLAATLRAAERRVKLGLLQRDELPDAVDDHEYPWRIEPDRLTLHFGEPKNTADYLEKLFAFAFGIKDGLIDLPGTYHGELGRPVRAELQHGLTLTFLQFGPHRRLDPPSRELFDYAGDGTSAVTVSLRRCHGYLHQDAWSKVTNKSGKFKPGIIEAPSAFNPGAVTRHLAFKTATRIEASAGEFLCGCFALVGCLSLPVNRGVGVLLVPEVVDLTRFARARPHMTPTDPRSCRVASPSDAALTMEVRLRGGRLRGRHGVARFHAMRMQPVPWNEKQKSRVSAVSINAGDAGRLRTYDVALGCLPPKIVRRVEVQSSGRGKKAVKSESRADYTVDSIVRPLVADNLAAGRYWYHDFVRLVRGQDDNNRPMHENTAYEREGLHRMAFHDETTEADEQAFIAAVHRAIAVRLGRIVVETMGLAAVKAKRQITPAVRNRWGREQERIRLSLLGAKTESQTVQAVTAVFGRAGGYNPELRDHQRAVHGVLFGSDWQRVRDLALFAAASYKKPESPEEIADDLPEDDLLEAAAQPSD